MNNNVNFKVLKDFFKMLLTDEDNERLTKVVTEILNTLMELERADFVGVAPYERGKERNGLRNGYKRRTLNTARFGTLEVLVPQVRDANGKFRIELFNRYQRSEKALFVAAAEMYFKGISTRKVAKLFHGVFGTDISAEFVSKAAKHLDEEIAKWRSEPLQQAVSYLIADATYHKVREGGPVHDVAVLIIAGVQADGHRRILHYEVADMESEATWRQAFESLKKRGLKGVKYIVSDAHAGLKRAIAKSFHDVIWQRCKVHFSRDFCGAVKNKKIKDELSRSLRIAWLQLDKNMAMQELKKATELLEKNGHRRLAMRLEEEFEETLNYMALPRSHWRRMSTSNFMERLNGEIRRRLYSVRIFPNIEALERLVGAILMETDEEWRFERLYINMEHSPEL